MRDLLGRSRSAFAAALALIALISILPGRISPASAVGESRTISFFHTHTRETITVTFRRNGAYDERALEQLNWFLRDWRSNETTKMDPRLFDILWEMQREMGTDAPLHVISAYRSPTTNGALRRRSGGVADNSLHMAGKAIDIRLPGTDTARVRATAMRVQYGGVGYYPGSDFVHVDTGSVRAWPRMSKDQLIALFPGGKTLHLPPSGTPLPGYEEARLEVQARQTALASLNPPAPGAWGDARRTGRLGEAKPGAAGPIQLASADAGGIGVTGSVAPRARDERSLLRALFHPPVEAVSAASTPLLHMAVLDQPQPLADVTPASDRLGVTFDGTGGPATTRFAGPAVQPLRVMAIP
ncbi:MAG TPA: DUF882 domain-containing protein [Microvirga sp.]|nr:DUF882 domain-containing protein [Microvirga sp.]